MVKTRLNKISQSNDKEIDPSSLQINSFGEKNEWHTKIYRLIPFAGRWIPLRKVERVSLLITLFGLLTLHFHHILHCRLRIKRRHAPPVADLCRDYQTGTAYFVSISRQNMVVQNLWQISKLICRFYRRYNLPKGLIFQKNATQRQQNILILTSYSNILGIQILVVV